MDSATQLADNTVWLPEGSWYEWYSGTMLQGPATLLRNYSLNEIPVIL
jgi:alpha-glucosidase (family GH31 glycosyl hydrolase)